MNRYELTDETATEIHRVDPEAETRQVARVQALRARRDARGGDAALARLQEDAAGTANLMPPIIAAARANVTMGEMCDALREAWGTWRETPVF